MPSAFLQGIFGKKKPTSTAASDELAKVEAALAAVPARIAAAEALLNRVADLSDDEHAAAEAELAAAKRSVERLGAQADDLRAAKADAERAEAAEALNALVNAARKRSEGSAKAIERYEACADALADAAAAMSAIDDEVAAANFAIAHAKRNGLDAPEPILTSHERFRYKAEQVEPDTVSTEKGWRYRGPSGQWQDVAVYMERDGKMTPNVPDAESYQRKITLPGRRRPAVYMASPTHSLQIPAARLGRPDHWPRTSS